MSKNKSIPEYSKKILYFPSQNFCSLKFSLFKKMCECVCVCVSFFFLNLFFYNIIFIISTFLQIILISIEAARIVP
jgi:hypothetical protein